METTSFKISEIKPIARRALMIADSHYFAWNARRQELFRAGMDESRRKKIRRALLAAIVDVNCTLEEVDLEWSEIAQPEVNFLNWAVLLTEGIGDDYIFLNETFAEGKTLLDFETLYDFDYDDYLFQEQARRQSFPDYAGIEYFAFKHPFWGRLLIDENFFYATFTSVATLLIDDIEEVGREYIDQLIPHHLVEGKHHGEQEKGGMRWDMREDANGMEAQLGELQMRWGDFLQERWLQMSRFFAQQKPTVYILDDSLDDDPHRFFIFNNETTLKKIRWRHFLSDCQLYNADYVEIEKQLGQEVSEARQFLDDNYRDIIKNFDPKIVKFQQKKKIILAESFFDDWF